MKKSKDVVLDSCVADLYRLLVLPRFRSGSLPGVLLSGTGGVDVRVVVASRCGSGLLLCLLYCCFGDAVVRVAFGSARSVRKSVAPLCAGVFAESSIWITFRRLRCLSLRC